jgi:hypothetical protein
MKRFMNIQKPLRQNQPTLKDLHPSSSESSLPNLKTPGQEMAVGDE